MSDSASATAAHWFEGQAALPLAHWLGELARRLKASPAEAADRVLSALEQPEVHARLLLLHDTRPTVKVPPNFGPPIQAAQIPSRYPGIRRTSGAVVRIGTAAPAPAAEVGPRGAAFVVAKLGAAWKRELRRARGANLDGVQVLGHRVGLTEAAAVATWPELEAMPALQLVKASQKADAALLEAIEACRPPSGYTKGDGWTPQLRAELLRQFEAITAAGASYEGALIELHRAWGYSKPAGKNGGPLAKCLTAARKARQQQQPRRQRAG